MDIHEDSSTIAGNLISAYQRFLLNTLYTGHPEKRPKYNCIMAQGIDPMVSAAQYLDKEHNENELKQVVSSPQVPANPAYTRCWGPPTQASISGETTRRL